MDEKQKESTYQDPAAVAFYEGAWSARHELMKQIVESDSSGDLFPALQKFNRFTSQYWLGIDDNGKPSWNKPKDHVGFPHEIRTHMKSSFKESLFDKPTYNSPIDFLLEFLDTSKFDAIVELGAGFGQNLIEIAGRGGPQDIPYYAGEFTQSGQKFTEYLASKSTKMKLIPFHFDHKNPNLSPVVEKGRILVFTCHSIEQVTKIPDELIKCIAGHAEEVTCFHFEPFGFQIEDDHLPRGPVSDLQEKYFIERNWNLNLAEVLFKMNAAQTINVVCVAKNIFAGHAECPTSLAYWTAKKSR